MLSYEGFSVVLSAFVCIPPVPFMFLLTRWRYPSWDTSRDVYASGGQADSFAHVRIPAA